MKIAGNVYEKDIVEWNRGKRLLKFSNAYGKETLYLFGENSGFFEYVQEKDSIVKQQNSFSIDIYRGGTLVKVFKLKYSCSPPPN